MVPNYTLDAEESDNLNAGFVFNRKFGLDWQSRFDANVFSRVQRDLIRLEAFGLGELAQFINEDEITASGLEFSTELSFRNNLRFSGSLTFQELIIAASENIEDRSFIDVKLPNIPDFFWNISTSYTADFGIAENDNVDLFYNLRYVDPFSVTYVLDEDNANPQNIIPSQYQHDLGFTYNWDKAYSSITLQINNLLDAELFDNYRVPKPGRYIALKVTFSK
ncbi:MAG: hypothetical protein AAFP70_12745 [Calditrichota bacterium]